MAITASGLYVITFRDCLDPTNIGLDLTATDHKMALVNDTHAPNFDTHDQFADLTNEVSGTGWAAGGVLLSAISAGATSMAPTLTVSSGSLVWDGNDVSVASTTLTSAMAAVIYADAETTPVADPLIILVDFVTAVSTSNGTLGVQWAAGGIASLDLTP